jgi:hypothetical protein
MYILPLAPIVKDTSATQKQDKVITNNLRYNVYTTFQQSSLHKRDFPYYRVQPGSSAS